MKKRAISKTIKEFISEVNEIGGVYHVGIDKNTACPVGAIRLTLRFDNCHWLYCENGIVHRRSLLFGSEDKSNIKIVGANSVELIREGERGRRVYDVITDSGERFTFYLNERKEEVKA